MQNLDHVFPPHCLGVRLVPEPSFDIQSNKFYTFTGEQGYKTAICYYGLKFGDFYYEVTVLKAKEPLPFAGVDPAIRTGFTVYEEEEKKKNLLEMALGATTRSYAFNSKQRLVTNAHFKK